jgi:hypothetical protein
MTFDDASHVQRWLEHLRWFLRAEEHSAAQTPDMEEHVPDYVDRDAGVRMRQMGEELNVLHMTIWRVLYKQLWQSIMRCAEACIESHGGHFELLL